MNELLTDENIKVLTGLLGFLLALWPFVKPHLDAKRQAQIEQIADAVVKGTEVAAREFPSAAKLDRAVIDAREMAKRYRIRLTDMQWAIEVDRAVYDLKQFGGELPKQVDSHSPNDAVQAENIHSLR